MKQGLLNRLEDRSVGKLPVVRNFTQGGYQDVERTE